MGQKSLIDTNPIIDFFSKKLTAAGKNLLSAIDPVISVITHIEILSNKNIASSEWLQIKEFIQLAAIYQLDNAVVEQTIILRQQYKIKTPDAIIAATALLNDFTLITRNSTDFKYIKGLTTVNPHTL